MAAITSSLSLARGLCFTCRTCRRNVVLRVLCVADVRTARPFIAMHPRSFIEMGVCKIHTGTYARHRVRPGAGPFTLFRRKSMTRVRMALVSIRRAIVLPDPRIVQFPAKSHLFPNAFCRMENGGSRGSAQRDPEINLTGRKRDAEATSAISGVLTRKLPIKLVFE